jgi:hypothetical protein
MDLGPNFTCDTPVPQSKILWRTSKLNIQEQDLTQLPWYVNCHGIKLSAASFGAYEDFAYGTNIANNKTTLTDSSTAETVGFQLVSTGAAARDFST